MMSEVIERCPTGIGGYDKICNGGFVKNSSNVIVGGPGSGKTTFLLQFLYNGVKKYNENGLYCSFEPDIIETLSDGQSYGWDFYKLAEERKIHFVKFSPQTSIEDLKSELTKVISQQDIRRICIDPISIIALNISDEGKIREKIFDLVSLLKRLKVTVVLADESMEADDSTIFRDGEWTKTDIIRFLCDSVSIFYSKPAREGIDASRSLRIEKMRRTNHSREIIGMEITNQGIELN